MLVRDWEALCLKVHQNDELSRARASRVHHNETFSLVDDSNEKQMRIEERRFELIKYSIIHSFTDLHDQIALLDDLKLIQFQLPSRIASNIQAISVCAI